MRDYREFRQDCNDAGIEVPELSSYSDSTVDLQPFIGREVTHNSYMPTKWLRATVELAARARYNPGRPLASALIPDELIDQGSVQQTTVQAICNASRRPLEADMSSGRSYHNYPGLVDVCRAAEVEFGYTFYAMEAVANPSAGLNIDTSDYGWNIIVDGADGGRPVAVTKSSGEKSTLLLEPVIIDGVPYPAGSIARIRTHHKYTEPEDAPRTITDISDVEGIGVMRLSTYAIPHAERRDVGIPDPYHGLELEDIRQIAIGGLAISRLATFVPRQQKS